MPTNCTFTGFVRDPAGWINQMDLMAITSDHEGLPMSLLEAMALGVRIVSRAVGGIPRLLQDGRFGRLVPTASAWAIAEAMADELSSEGTHDFKLARSVFPPELTAGAMAQQYTRVYESATSVRRRAAQVGH